MLAYNVFTATSIELNRRTLLTPLRTFMRCNMRAVSNPPTAIFSFVSPVYFRTPGNQSNRFNHDAIRRMPVVWTQQFGDSVRPTFHHKLHQNCAISW